MPSFRIEKINQIIKKELSWLILREIEFPEGVLATITRVESLSNLKESRVFVSVIPDEKSKDVLFILNKNIYFLQQEINKKLRIKVVPKIIFKKEEKTAQAARIESILTELKKDQK